MPSDLLLALEGILQALSLGLDMNTLSNRPKVKRLIDTLHGSRQSLMAFATREPFGPSPLEVADFSKSATAVLEAIEALRPHLAPSLRALTAFSEALKATVDLAYARRISRLDAIRVIEAIDKLIPYLEQDHVLPSQGR